MSCPECEAPVTDGARFCASCGADLGDVETGQHADDGHGDGAAAHATTATTAVDPGTTTAVGAIGGPLGDDDDDALFGARRRTETTAAIITCPRCGAANSEARLLCGRCGADLESGDVASGIDVVRSGPANDVVGPVDVRDRSDRPRTAMIVATIVVVGALVGVGVGVWAVQAGRDDGTARPTFDGAVYPGEPVDLRVGGVGASSTRAPAGETAYGAANMVDGDRTTAWSHDPQNQAADEVDLAFALEEPAWVTDVVLAVGRQEDATSQVADGRPSRVLLVVDDDPVAELQLIDVDEFQRVTLPEPVLAQTVRLVVEEVVPGDSFPEVSISEVAFLGHIATGDDLARVTG